MKQTLKYIYERLFEWQKYAEMKHSITITLASAVIAFSSTFFSDNKILNILSSAVIIFALISIIYSFVALTSRNVKINKKKKIIYENNLLLYKNVATFDEYGYVEQIKKIYDFPKGYKPDEFDYDLARQTITVAKLVNLKLSYFNFALFYLLVSILCGIAIVCIRGNLV